MGCWSRWGRRLWLILHLICTIGHFSSGLSDIELQKLFHEAEQASAIHRWHETSSRRLQEVNDVDFEPIRIHLDTSRLESTSNSTNKDKIDWILQEVLPPARDYWQRTLRVRPIQGNLQLNVFELLERQYCGLESLGPVLLTHISDGIPNTDLVVYVSAADELCTASTFALALFCNLDQDTDRPIAGSMNVCLNTIDLENAGILQLQESISIVMHELGHVLGFSSNSFPFFRDDSGEPRVPRPFQFAEVTCVNGENRELLPVMDSLLQWETDLFGQRTAYIVTPRVRTVARNHFNCQRLLGAALENQPTSSRSCYGDHWEELHYATESMSAIKQQPGGAPMSPLSLALLEDSGWYRADYTQSQVSVWGHGAGCGFVDQPCLDKSSRGTSVPEAGRGFFCSIERETGCSANHQHKQMCFLFSYSTEVDQQWFDNPMLGGPIGMAFCPAFLATYKGFGGRTVPLHCQDESLQPSVNAFGEVYGSNSHCIQATALEPLCLPTLCDKDNHELRIIVRGEWVTCEYDFQEIDVIAGQVATTITCPRLTQICPEFFCPYSCSGNGICSYTGTQTGLKNATCECFDPSDLSPGCTGSQVQSNSTESSSKSPVNITNATDTPSSLPSFLASDIPSDSPSMLPSAMLSSLPSLHPSKTPSLHPSSIPSLLSPSSPTSSLIESSSAKPSPASSFPSMASLLPGATNAETSTPTSQAATSTSQAIPTSYASRLLPLHYLLILSLG